MAAKKKSEISEEMKLQVNLNVSVRVTCDLINPTFIIQDVYKDVSYLKLSRSLPRGVNMFNFAKNFSNLQELDLSGNGIGPQGFRVIMIAMEKNATIRWLNVSGNMTDTDSAESVGKMLSSNEMLIHLDLSSNNLGRDYLSRCVGSALRTNTTLKTLIMQSCGTTDLSTLLVGLHGNNTLSHLDVSHNDISDRKQLGIGLAKCLKKPDCALENVQIRRCAVNCEGVSALSDGIRDNKSLRHLNIGGSEVSDVVRFLTVCFCHPTLQSLAASDCKVKAGINKDCLCVPSEPSPLQTVSLNNCSLTDEVFKTLAEKLPSGTLCHLEELDISSNPDLTTKSLLHVLRLSTVDEVCVTLRQLQLAVNNADDLPQCLATGILPNLEVLDLRRAKISPGSVGQLAPSIACLKSLVLDGLKLSGTVALPTLLKGGSLVLECLSLNSCALNDSDLTVIADSLKQGLNIQMLNLSANRLTDAGVTQLVAALLKKPPHSLLAIDLSENKIGRDGALQLEKLYSKKSNLHTLNVSRNNIDAEGLVAIVKCLKKGSPLLALNLQDQDSSFDEEDCDNIFKALAQTLGYKLQFNGEDLELGTCSYPELRHGLMVNLTGLADNPGPVGAALDCVAFKTDFKKKKLPYLAFSDVLKLSSVIKGNDSEDCILSIDEWKHIIGASKEAPSWLQVQEHRDHCVYILGLPANLTEVKLEGLLEAEADCNIKEVCLMKDPVLRCNNGAAWVLMADEESVKKAVDWYSSGEAGVYNQPFIVSQVKVVVDDDLNIEAVEKARRDMAERQTQRRKEDDKHRLLIATSYSESQERHGYRLKHPAYADGRIW